MRIHKAFIRCAAAVAAVTLATAVATGLTRTTDGGYGQVYNGDLSYKVINNTTTPVPEGGDAEAQPEGLLIVDCNYQKRNHRVLKDTTKDNILCLMRFGETDPFTYSVWVETTTAVIGRSHYSSEMHTSEIEWDCRPGEKMELTFTGSGTSVTYSKTCTGTAYTDMDDMEDDYSTGDDDDDND